MRSPELRVAESVWLLRIAGAHMRALVNSFLDIWHGNEAQLSASLPEAIETFEKAVAAEDFDAAAILVGEGVGLIHDVRPAADIVRDMVRGATDILDRRAGN